MYCKYSRLKLLPIPEMTLYIFLLQSKAISTYWVCLCVCRFVCLTPEAGAICTGVNSDQIPLLCWTIAHHNRPAFAHGQYQDQTNPRPYKEYYKTPFISSCCQWFIVGLWTLNSILVSQRYTYFLFSRKASLA